METVTNKTHAQSHTIIKMPVHLPNMQAIYSQENEEQEATKRAVNRRTRLTAYFILNNDNTSTQEYFYHKIPNYFVFEKLRGIWKKRMRGGESVIRRMITVDPTDEEHYLLRVWMLYIKGSKSFWDLFNCLRTVW